MYRFRLSVFGLVFLVCSGAQAGSLLGNLGCNINGILASVNDTVGCVTHTVGDAVTCVLGTCDGGDVVASAPAPPAQAAAAAPRKRIGLLRRIFGD